MIIEIRAFINKAKESLTASKLLASGELYNFAGSRAYYTMFYIAEAFLWTKGLTFSSHAAVISAFGKEIARAGIVPIQFHRYLIDAQNQRTLADYGIDEETVLTQNEVSELILQSEEFIKWAEEVLIE